MLEHYPLASSPAAFYIRLDRGRCEYEVHPRSAEDQKAILHYKIRWCC